MNTPQIRQSHTIRKIRLSVILLMIGFFFIHINANAQQGLYDYKDFTPYEKHRFDLTVDTYKKVADAKETMSPEAQLALALILSKPESTGTNNDYEVMIAKESYLVDLFNVVSLSRPLSYYNTEALHDALILSIFAPIAECYKQQKARIENTRTPLDNEREQKRTISNVALKRNIKSAFSLWTKKGDFEKTDQYLLRLQENAVEKFDSICSIESRKQFRKTLYLNRLGYDADSETDTILFFHTINKEDTIKCSPFIMFGHVPLECKKEFCYAACPPNGIFPLNIYRYHGFLVTTLAKLKYCGEYYDFKSNIAPSENILIDYSELGYDNSDLNKVMIGHRFDYNQYIEERVTWTDSINLLVEQAKKRIECVKELKYYFRFPENNVYNSYISLFEYSHPWVKDKAFFLFNMNDITKRKDTLLKLMSESEESAKSSFSKFRFLFNSDEEFLEFFLNENGVDISQLIDLIYQRFEETSLKITDAKKLKGAYGSTLGKEMLNYCNLCDVEYERSSYSHYYLYQTINELFMLFISNNKAMKGAYRNFKRKHNVRYCYKFMESYIKGD